METLSLATNTNSPAQQRLGLLFIVLMIAALLALSGCGGSSSGAPVTSNPPPNNGGNNDGFSYKGANAAAAEDVLRFQTNLWINMAPENRCGSCHSTQQPTFTRGDDINLAYAQVIDNGLVDLANPSMSRLVTKVAGGHNCWAADPVVCGDIFTTWISAWANNTGTEPNPIVLTPPEEREVGSSKSFPDSPSGFQTTVYPLLTQYCGSCHSESAVTRQQPYFASTDINIAYEAAKARMRLDNPASSRFVQRLRTDFHNCWDNDCNASANSMQAQIAAFAGSIPETVVNPNLVMSNAVGLGDAFVLTSGGRVDTNLIAKYEFKTGRGTIAYDTSGVEPATNLNLVGNVGWSSAWGIRLADNGKAQASTAESRKIYNLIRGAGEYSIETWIIPDNVAQGMNDNNPARIVSLSGAADMRNFTLGQYEENYSFLNRTNQSDANGLDELVTNGGAVASLQHVVATFDPINGRRIYINGELREAVDPHVGAALADWDNSYALVVGNEVSNNRMWQGSMRFLGIHNRAMAADDIVKNFEVGVGARYLLLFGVGDLINVPYSYVVFEVQQFDDYGYLFSQPFFTIIADPETGITAQLPGTIDLRGIRIGINGEEVRAGQAFANLTAQLSSSAIAAGEGRQLLSNLGTVIEAKRGPENDQFFLTFDQIGGHASTFDRTPPYIEPAEPAPIEGQPHMGVRTFDEINFTLAALTGVPRTEATVAGVFEKVKQQLPSSADINGFLTAHQMGVTQLTVAYCKAVVANTSLRQDLFCGGSPCSINFSTSANGFAPGDRTQVFDALLQRLIASDVDGSVLENQANPADQHAHLNALVNEMAARGATTGETIMASCAAAYGSAIMLLK